VVNPPPAVDNVQVLDVPEVQPERPGGIVPETKLQVGVAGKLLAVKTCEYELPTVKAAVA